MSSEAICLIIGTVLGILLGIKIGILIKSKP